MNTDEPRPSSVQAPPPERNITAPIATFGIDGTIILGGGLRCHAEYKVNVTTANGESWSIYRRYKDFLTFHEMLKKLIDPYFITELDELFPKKFPLGSLASTSTEIAVNRQIAFAKYFEYVLTTQEFHALSQQFLDFKNHGISAVSLQLGFGRISREMFCKTKICKGYFGIWRMSYLALLKDGTIAVLPSINTDLNHASLQLSLVNGDVSVVPLHDRNIIEITNLATNLLLKLSFPDAADAAYWIRTLSDLAISTDVAGASRRPSSKRASLEPTPAASRAAGTWPKSSSGSSSPTSAAAQEEHIHAKGVGNTTDELSELYGI